jgi:hypothetical protein
VLWVSVRGRVIGGGGVIVRCGGGGGGVGGGGGGLGTRSRSRSGGRDSRRSHRSSPASDVVVIAITPGTMNSLRSRVIIIIVPPTAYFPFSSNKPIRARLSRVR